MRIYYKNIKYTQYTMTVLIHNNDDVDIAGSVEEIKTVNFQDKRESDSYVLDAMNQMKEKFDENEQKVNSIKRKCLSFRNELMIAAGMICCIDDIMHEFDMSDVPGEVGIMMSVLRGRIVEFIERKIINDKSLQMQHDEDYDEPSITATVRVVPN